MKNFESTFSKIISSEAFPAEISGTNNLSYIALMFSKYLYQQNSKQKFLFLVKNREEVAQLQSDLKNIGLVSTRALKASDITPYNSIFPSDISTGDRMGFLSSALEALSQVFIASYSDMFQWTASSEFFRQSSVRLKKGQDLPKDFFSQLSDLGYRKVDTVEDPLTYANRGGIIDIFSPSYEQAFRLELFDDEIENIKCFDVETQRSTLPLEEAVISPARECLYAFSDIEDCIQNWKNICVERNVDPKDKFEFISKLIKRQYFHGIDYLIPFFHKDKCRVIDHFSQFTKLVIDRDLGISNFDSLVSQLELEKADCPDTEIKPEPIDLYDLSGKIESTNIISFHNLQIHDDSSTPSELLTVENIGGLSDYKPKALNSSPPIVQKVKAWLHQDFQILISLNSPTQIERAKLILENHSVPFESVDNISKAFRSAGKAKIYLCETPLNSSFKSESDQYILVNAAAFFGKQSPRHSVKSKISKDSSKAFSLSEIHLGDKIVHIQHGVGIYQGLSVMDVQGNPSEFVFITYKGGDKLYIPVYKIGLLQKYNGAHEVDRLGSKSWEKAKIKVKSAIKDIADELLRLYAKRGQILRPPHSPAGDSFDRFESEFPFVETEDQIKSIQDILSDFNKENPMDRLICGDVGFGKTEIAMRAAFLALEQGKQVAILVPTTVLAFQHTENFKKRFKNWPFSISTLSRFTSTKETKEILQNIKLGHADIIIGTHRLLSSDLNFPKLGLLIIDEEHRFGVAHKEKLKQLKNNIDCLSLSATPIPRTLNMGLVGIRDLSVINTPPLDRLPTKTFVVRYSESSIKTAIEAELSRDGQVYFIHNRVKSIESKAHELRELFPSARLAVAHGQMKEAELEKVMLNFYARKIDILLCTAIVENGVDNPFANTMIIDNAHQMGLSQLYQFRGRVGRAKERAFCYLVIPQNLKLDEEAQTRLKVIQDNTALGSGLKIAHHDLELRGAGSILGAEQSGELNTVGYDLYLELLEQSLREAKGEIVDEESIEPEINLRIPALIPDSYISDIRTRLSYYKAMSEIQSEEDLEKIESDLIEQFGRIPNELLNLMGVMLIRKYCKSLGIKDVSAGTVNLSFAFTIKTKINVTKLVELSLKQATKYKLTPDNRLLVKLPALGWPQVLQEVKLLESFL